MLVGVDSRFHVSEQCFWGIMKKGEVIVFFSFGVNRTHICTTVKFEQERIFEERSIPFISVISTIFTNK